MITQRTIQEVINTAQVQDIIEDYVTLKRRGANMLGLCPFHDEKTPSFTVSPSKNIYKCFGCGKGGGAVQFLMEHDNLSFPESIRTLANRYNITIEEDKRENDEEYAEQRKLHDSYYIINNFAAEFYKKNLFETEDGKKIAQSYFKERGFLESTIQKFDLGFAMDDSKALLTKAKSEQFNEEYLQTLGLASAKGYDFFRNRVMFTIHNVSGKIIAFAGRTLSSGKKQPKYINSPETPIYNKRKVLYAMHLAKNEIRKQNNCFIVEGYTDVISLFQNGVENVVASSGTALTSDQVRLVKRFTDNITFLYDGDPAGIKAAMRGLDIVLESNMNVKLVLLPEGEDPDSFIKKSGNEKFLAYVKDQAKDFIYFKLDQLKEDAGNDPIKRTEMAKDIIGSIAKIRDPLKRSFYIKDASIALETDEALLIREIKKIITAEIKRKNLEKEREERRSIATQSADPSSGPNGVSDIPAEPAYLDNYDFDETGFVTPPRQAKQKSFKKHHHEYQEKDLARIIVVGGDKIIQDIDEKEIVVADFIYSNIHDIFEHFENPIYKQIIQEGFEFIESENASDFPISQYFINHENSEISRFAVDSNSPKYEFAKWYEKDVTLQTQPLPDSNFYRDSLSSILRFKMKKVNTVIAKIQSRITQDEVKADPEKSKLLLMAYQKLSAERSVLADRLGTVIPGK